MYIMKSEASNGVDAPCVRRAVLTLSLFLCRELLVGYQLEFLFDYWDSGLPTMCWDEETDTWKISTTGNENSRAEIPQVLYSRV